ncbi:chromosome segregation protein SMC [Methylocystis bryophila]|uniref:Chromosome partition protein Smc n=1 Tax=Methylocystis bryophila TaxID=655015 RepID=A0A1W6MR05_9HYPH|nr:chromosome segregation protein SMC [Methylocystis bryophila]ARN80024.1 chromosome segregation protein SMC [Methylocystis bryophila]BDV39936.1 chromosome partition protein Smc [Methylocystis bryophila]
MHFLRLRLLGFKSFCEHTEFLIEPGLTGVVGPNGCGKSNLVEALRWVMGENSFKNMRATGMDDVIFAGGGSRPARNVAEVGLVLDNSQRSAPAAFNDEDTLEVTRRIEREQGSVYRVNGREVRAKDVQLLFADASTGARSPALVRQGQIGEIIGAKPQARRRVLEEAAGIAGLHSRRHEAELRLQGASENLLRLEDVLKQVDSQVESLRRQARGASRYRAVAAQIRQNEALAALIGHRAATARLAEAERKFAADTTIVNERMIEQAAAAREQALAAHELPSLRDKEAEAGAALHRLIVARDALDVEEKRAQERVGELTRRIEQFGRDLERERSLIQDAAEVAQRLEEERGELIEAEGDCREREEAARARLVEIEATLAATEDELHEAQDSLASVNARARSFQATIEEEGRRIARFEAELTRLNTEFALIASEGGGADDLARLEASLELATETAQAADEAAELAAARHQEAREMEAASRAPLAAAEARAQRLDTESRTLEKLLNAGSGDPWTPVVEEIVVAKGYETALGAALGDDLDASSDPEAPAHWALTDAANDASLPAGAKPLSGVVQAPAAMQRRLQQIGVVAREEGSRLRALLKPGQRLVSKEGDLWRWDGFTQAAEAPTAAARRLVEKNRLSELRQEAEEARYLADAAAEEAEAARESMREAQQAESDAREEQRRTRSRLDETRDRHAAAERRQAQIGQRLSALEAAKTQTIENRDEAAQKRAAAQAALEALEEPAFLAGALESLRARAQAERAQAGEARAALTAFAHEASMRASRQAAIQRESASWSQRRDHAQDRIGEIEERLHAARQEQEELAEAPIEFERQRRALRNGVEEAEAARRAASDARVQGETRLAEGDRAARAALDALSAAREEKARSEAQLEAARQRAADVAHAIAHELEATPEALVSLAGVSPGEDLPPADVVERKLETLRADRERLGAVNLRADDELAAIEAQQSKMCAERDDLSEAIKKLRAAIASLNKEGRERLLAAFDRVNAHFKELFTLLFDGGTAELALVESEDPLEAGLEIFARPPGKKPAAMSLLSGGEQALTAMSLIFAVFLTNPSPICVLDEVDAPLDDYNVERFCDLLDEMRKKTDTRFVAITHNPITMARMDRLFGVTQAERGVSQLVSVDLAQAERFLLAS